MGSIQGTIATAAKRAAYSASQLARIAWYTGHYMAGRRRMGPLVNPTWLTALAWPIAVLIAALNVWLLTQVFMGA